MNRHHKDLETRFEQLVTEHSGTLLRALCGMLPLAEAEEVLQEASLKVWSCLYSIDKEAQKPYWFSTARNLGISRLRHDKVHRDAIHLLVPLEEVRMETDLAEIHACQESEALLLEAINELPPVCRNVFVFRKIDGYSQKEIAEKLGVSVNTVENHISNGMKFCRRYLTARLDRETAEINKFQRLS